MGLREVAQNMAARITSNSVNGFAVLADFIAPDNTAVTVNVIHSKHHLGVDGEGNMVNTKKAHITVSESLLIASSYPVRNSNGEVDMVNHRINVADSTGLVKNYIAKSVFPDETLGLIVLILDDYE